MSFACSLNSPLFNRTANVGQAHVRAIIEKLGFTMPPVNANGEGTPPSTAAVLGQISGSPRRVHQMSGVVLAALLKKSLTPVKLPSLVKSYDFTRPEHALAATALEVDDRHRAEHGRQAARGTAAEVAAWKRRSAIRRVARRRAR